MVKAKQRSGIKHLLSSVWVKRISVILLCFALALVTAATAAFPNTYPFGIAVVSAASGVTATLASMAGALIGSAGIPKLGGAYAAIITLLTVSRLLLSRWLADDGQTAKSKTSVPNSPDNTQNSAKSRSRNDRLRTIITRIRESPGQVLTSLKSVKAGGAMLRENIRVRVALSACAALFGGAWSVVRGGYDYYDLFGAVFSLLITPLVTYLFYAARERKMRYSPIREVAVYFTAAVITLSLTSLAHGGLDGLHETILGESRGVVFDLGVLFAFAAAVVCATEFGVHRGALVGLACGIVMQPSYAPLYAIAAMVGGTFAAYSKTFAVLSAGALGSAWAIYVAGFNGMTEVFPPIVAACAVLIPAYRYNIVNLPESLFGAELYRSGRSLSWGNSSLVMADISAKNMKKRLNSLSDGMMSVSAVLGGMSDRLTKPARADYEEISERAFDTYCHTCKMRERCHDSKNSKTEPVIHRITDELMRDGVVTAGTIPSQLASSCWNIGRILDEINLEAGKKIAEMRRGDKLSVSAADLSLAGEIMRQAAKSETAEGEVDDKLSAKLKRLLTYHNFGAASVTVYGERRKHIFVGDVDLTATRMGGDDIRRLFESFVGTRLSNPEFELDGAVLSMRMNSVNLYECRSGMYSCAASQVLRYWQEVRNCGADSQDEDCAVNEETDGITTADEASEDMDSAKTIEIPQISVTDSVPDEVCGDGITAFEVNGKYYMLLSDGMGSGKEAALTSGVVVSLLERLIRSGAELETALKMLNQVVRQTERECSATVDIAEIDLMTGEAKFIKSGAAPSFVLRDGSIFRLQSKTVPIGIIRALDAEMIKFDVREGDTVVMVSDGAARSYDEAPWLLDLMTDDETVLHGDERNAAITIVSEAALRGGRDDITCGIVRIKKAG